MAAPAAHAAARQVTTNLQTMGDGLLPLTDGMKNILEDIAQGSEQLRATFNSLFNIVSTSTDAQSHLASDVAAIVNGNKDATAKLAQAEAGRRELETKFNQLQQQQQQLQQQNEQFKQQAQQAVQETKQLQQSHEELTTLHTSQLVQIQTNLQTLQALKTELTVLQQEVKRIHLQSTAYDCIKLYVKYPLLLKVRQVAMANPSIISDQSPMTLESLRNSQIVLTRTTQQMFQQVQSDVNVVLDQLKSIGVNQPNGFWSEYLQKITDTYQFIINAFADPLTGGGYLIYCWSLETHPKLVIDSSLEPQLKELIIAINQSG